MKICILSREEQASVYPAVLEMLIQADNDFVPPLSARSSSTQQDLSAGTKRSTGVEEYFHQLQTQRFAAVYEGDSVIAFVSYKENYTCEYIPAETLPNIYLSTMIVRPEFRGRGVTTALYEKLFSAYAHMHIYTRTWSENHAHIRVLEKFGFSLVKTLPDHRGPGIHTVYFGRLPQP